MSDHSLDGPFTPTLHQCEGGHEWTAQSDGGVSPSYGLGLTSCKFAGWDPTRCPEPEYLPIADDCGLVRGVRCPDCGAVRLPRDMLPGISCTPWEIYKREQATGHACQPPTPICGKPSVRAWAWKRVRRDVYTADRRHKKPAWTMDWIEVVDGQALDVGEQGALL